MGFNKVNYSRSKFYLSLLLFQQTKQKSLYYKCDCNVNHVYSVILVLVLGYVTTALPGELWGDSGFCSQRLFGRPPQGPNGSAAPQESNIASKQVSERSLCLLMLSKIHFPRCVEIKTPFVAGQKLLYRASLGGSRRQSRTVYRPTSI